ncbi:MAG: alpha/beta hydrolase [Chloroflexi bacterium]|nr:alpha/beta hydrolase [Chloroflexota bacterium]
MLYNEYGASDAPPLLLVHGSGGTGASEWKTVRDGLAKHFRVLAPDCRGHGKTLDPRNEYTFDLLANDLAEFLRALHIAPAFVVGHSNGGNVALVLTVEHADVVKKSVVMAGNAYVSADLLRYGQADWSDRISATWGAELAALHDAPRYPGYWRALMDRTGREIARAPNYTPNDLHRVKTPVLVIQGANDSVNAPSHHAEFMAENLANAQLWLAPDTGHSVHEEHPHEWVERVAKFFWE